MDKTNAWISRIPSIAEIDTSSPTLQLNIALSILAFEQKRICATFYCCNACYHERWVKILLPCLIRPRYLSCARPRPSLSVSDEGYYRYASGAIYFYLYWLPMLCFADELFVLLIVAGYVIIPLLLNLFFTMCVIIYIYTYVNIDCIILRPGLFTGMLLHMRGVDKRTKTKSEGRHSPMFLQVHAGIVKFVSFQKNPTICQITNCYIKLLCNKTMLTTKG